MLLDEGRASSLTDLRPSPANPPYHKKCRMFLSTTKGRIWRYARTYRTWENLQRPNILSFHGAVSRSMRSTSSRGMWTAPANLSALSTPRSTISWTVVRVRPRYSAASVTVIFLRFLSSTLITSSPGKDWGRNTPAKLGYPGPVSTWYSYSVRCPPTSAPVRACARQRSRRGPAWPSPPRTDRAPRRGH